MDNSEWKAVRWLIFALCVLVFSPDRPTAHVPICGPYDTCMGCHDCCDYQFYHCTSDATAAYSECVFSGRTEEECAGERGQDLAFCQSMNNGCTEACDLSSLCQPRGGGGDPIEEPPKPIDFGRLTANPLMCQQREHGGAARQAGTDMLALTLPLKRQDLDVEEGLNIPLPKGYSHVGVAVTLNGREGDLLGTRVRFSLDGTRQPAGKRLYRDASSLMLPSFSTGCYQIGGETLRLEPVGAGLVDGFTVHLTLTR